MPPTPRSRKPSQGGIQYFPSDWTARCEALCRKTGEQCPHTCDSQVSTTIAGRVVMDENWFSILGRPVRLCRGHWRSWHARAKRLLSLPLIKGGHLSPYNHTGYGAMVIRQDRIDFTQDPPIARIPEAWGWIGWQGNIPPGLLEKIPQYHLPHPTPPCPTNC